MGAFNSKRRRFLQIASGAATAGLVAPFAIGKAMGASTGRVVVVGGGFGGATAAKYLKRLHPGLDVTLIEPAREFYTCPFSNLYLGGMRELQHIAHGYDELRNRYGVQVVHQRAEDVDGVAHTVRLTDGSLLGYDKLVLSPGIDIDFDRLDGYTPAVAEQVPHAWLAGEQSRILRRQLEAMEDGGVFVLTAPDNPFRCPPGPYERVSQIAHYFSQHKPRSKILLLDAKEAFSKQGLFMDGWNALYPGIIEWVPASADGAIVRVDATERAVESVFGELHRADVLNVVPPQKAGVIAARAGVTNGSGWAPVKPLTFESQLVDDIYVIGDASIATPMPKSGFCASAQARVTAHAIVAALQGRDPLPPAWTNTCYSVLAPDYAISVAGVYRLVDGEIVTVEGSGGLSPRDAGPEVRRAEAEYAVRWYNAIAMDAWGTTGMPSSV
jgi:sulfide dehydrogenase [flavocytochrome c] flavoprotein chain